MKKILIVLLILSANIFAECCLTYIHDSLVAIKPYKWAGSTRYPDVKLYPAWDSAHSDINFCNYFIFTVEVSMNGNRGITKTCRFTKIDDKKYLFRYTTFTWDNIAQTGSTFDYSPPDSIRTLKCTPTTGIEDSTASEKFYIPETNNLLYVNVFDIRGRLVTTRKTDKINNLHGFYILQYVTEKNSYFRKKIFN